MASDKLSNLRITVWPDTRLPVPPVWVHNVVLHKNKQFGDFLIYQAAAGTGYVSLPEEFYLRELIDLDLNSNEEILEFSRTFGRLSSPGWRDLPGRDYRQKILHLPQLKTIDYLQNNFLESGGYEHDDDKYEYIPIEDFKVHAMTLRNLVRIWLMLSGQFDLQTLRENWQNVWKPPHNENNAALHLREFINAGLWPFQVHLKIHYPDSESGSKTFQDSIAGAHFDTHSIYSAVCLQIANDIAANAEYKRCASESCNRLFYRQRGRSEYGFYRTRKVDYCDAHCARAQASRELRRRRTRARQLRRDGETLKSITATTGAKMETVKRWTADVKPVRSKGKPKKKRVNNG